MALSAAHPSHLPPDFLSTRINITPPSSSITPRLPTIAPTAEESRVRLTVPVLVRKRRVRGVRLHHVRPLFFPGPEAEHERLERALQHFVADLRKLLREE